MKKFTTISVLLSCAALAFGQAQDEKQIEQLRQTMQEQTLASKDKKVTSLNLNNVSVKEAARLIAMATSTPIIVSYDAGQVEVDIHLQNLTAVNAVEAICRSAGLWYQLSQRDGMLHIMTAEEFKSTLQFNREEKVEVVQVLYPTAEDIGDALAKLFVDRVIWIDPSDNSGDRYNQISKALKRMDLLSERGSFDIADSSSSSSSSDENDDDDDDEDIDANMLAAAQLDPSKINQNTIYNLFSQNSGMSQKDLQFNAVINTPGVVFISVLPETNSIMLRSSDGSAVEEMMRVIEKLDKPSSQVLLEVKILSVLLDDSKYSSVDLLFATDDGTVSGGFADGSLSSSGGNSILKPTSYDSSTGSGLVPQGSGIDSQAAIFNVINDNFKARIQVLENNERVTQLASPNLVVSNNESTTIFIGTETTVLEKAESTTTYLESTTGGYNESISWSIDAPRRNIGTSLLLTPNIHADRTVTLSLLQESSSLGQTVENVFSGGSTGEQYFTSQNVDLQRIVTTVIGKDKEFMVIGGLITEKVALVAQKTPGLSDIPVIGDLLFTRKESVRQRSEVLVIIRPFVMIAPGEAQLVSQSYLERMSQHPAAKEDLPSLMVNDSSELAKPKIVNPNDPWLIRMFDKATGWNVDDSTSFDVTLQRSRQERRDNHQAALEEIERLQKNEE